MLADNLRDTISEDLTTQELMTIWYIVQRHIAWAKSGGVGPAPEDFEYEGDGDLPEWN